ncbi:PhoH family protein [Candidatus Saccharibacteria bacterium]|nr:PhoH family protein [Candidatus Saccharibacteria bacterium]
MLDLNRNFFVIDTNVLVSYPDIIPNGGGETKIFDNPIVDMTDAHIVIPSAVVRELSSFKKEKSERGEVARVLLRRLRRLVENKIHGMDENYHLESPVELSDGRLMSILPVHADFKKRFPFRPSEDDMDGQIILATLTTMYLVENLESGFDGKHESIDLADSSSRLGVTSDKVTLLTNDNGLAIRARARGIKTSRYGYSIPDPYTGRREVVVPNEIFNEFWKERRLDRDLWEAYFPDEAPLVANEFISMKPEDMKSITLPEDYVRGNDEFFCHIGRYDQREDAIMGLRYIQDAPYAIRSEGQAMYTEALLNPDIAVVICTGPAGSGKTYLPTIYGLQACARKIYIDVVVVPCSNTGNRGALPGGLNEKMILDTGPIRNAIRNYLLKETAHFRNKREKQIDYFAYATVDDLMKDVGDDEDEYEHPIDAKVNAIWAKYFRNIPVESARGLDFSAELILYDEFQDQSPSQADMLVKRIGEWGKVVITGDIKQIHAPYVDEYNNGITYATSLLYDFPMVARVSLLKDEVERHPLVKMIAERQAKQKAF